MLLKLDSHQVGTSRDIWKYKWSYTGGWKRFWNYLQKKCSRRFGHNHGPSSGGSESENFTQKHRYKQDAD